MVVRADDRGLGIQTWEIARAMQPDKVLVVVPEGHQHVKSFPNRFFRDKGMMQVVSAGDMGQPNIVGRFCSSVDLIYSAETFYDWRFCDIARARGARTVLHANPEFVGHWRDPAMPQPDVWWSPTPWLRDHPNMPWVVEVVPMPVPLDRWPKPRQRDFDEPVSFLHIAGHQAMADRNGTRLLSVALRRTTAKFKLTVTSQLPRLPHLNLPDNVEYTTIRRNVDNYWDLYAGHDVLLLPRRYGGLCLPTIEASGAGMASVMTSSSPNFMWPSVLVGAKPGDPIETSVGTVPTFNADVDELAMVVDRFATDEAYLHDEQLFARAWAEAHSWEVLWMEWKHALGRAAER